MLLIDGANKQDSDNEALAKMIDDVNETVNTKILGTRWRKSNWKVNLTKEGTAAEQPMTNNHTRKIINVFDNLVSVCVMDEEQREHWLECVDLWREVVETVRQKIYFTDEQINVFQRLCDTFFQKWINLHGRDRVGNYVHMIRAGHVFILFTKMA